MNNDVFRNFLLQVQSNPRDALSKLGDPEFDDAVELAVRNRLVKGIVARRVASGRLTVERLSNDQFILTANGEGYLSGKSL